MINRWALCSGISYSVQHDFLYFDSNSKVYDKIRTRFTNFSKTLSKKKPRHPPDRTKMDAISNLPVNSVRNIRSQWQTVTYAASLIPGQDRI